MIEHKPESPIDRITLAISRIGMLMTAAVVAIMFYEVIMRYFFERPTLWVNEMSLWLGGFIYLLAALYVLQQRGHIRITMLYDIVPRWVQRVFDIISTVCIIIFGAMIIQGGLNEALQKYGRWETFGTAWDPPIPATMKPAIIIVAAMLILQAISNLIADWHKTPVREGVTDEDEINELRRSSSYSQTVNDRHD